MPIGNGIITAYTYKQALDRSYKKGIKLQGMYRFNKLKK